MKFLKNNLCIIIMIIFLVAFLTWYEIEDLRFLGELLGIQLRLDLLQRDVDHLHTFIYRYEHRV